MLPMPHLPYSLNGTPYEVRAQGFICKTEIFIVFREYLIIIGSKIFFNIIHFHWFLIYLLDGIPESEALSVNVKNTNKQYNPISKPSLGVILPSNTFSLIY